MPAENILFPRPCYEGMISTSLEVIWEISVQLTEEHTKYLIENLSSALDDISRGVQ